MNNCIIVRYGEIALKGKNRDHFEKRLVRNIKDALRKNNARYGKIQRLRNRIIIHTKSTCTFLKRVFGITSFSPAIKTNAQSTPIKKAAETLINTLTSKHTFRVTTKKILSKKKLSSTELNIQLGTFIEKTTKAAVDLENYNFELGIEIINDAAFVFSQRSNGFGGLPVGSEGVVLSLINGTQSLLASLLMMRRGCIVIPVAFNKRDISLLKTYAYGCLMELKKIKTEKETDAMASEYHAAALVVGDTLDTFNKVTTNLPVLRPLIGYPTKEIETRLKEYVH